MIHKLEVDSVHLKYGIRTILSDVYLKIETGKVTGLLGRNGGGKTSLMNIIFGNLSPSGMSLRLDEVRVPVAYQTKDLLSYLPQYHYIPEQLRLKRVFLDYNLEYGQLESIFPEFIGKYNSRISDLSGGQRRLIELYIVLRSESKFALLDEPFSHLSPVHIEAIKELILQEKEKKGILVTDHMYRHIIELSAHLYVLTEGKINLVKDPEDIKRFGYVTLLD